MFKKSKCLRKANVLGKQMLGHFKVDPVLKIDENLF